MRVAICLAAAITLVSAASAAAQSTVFLVRHAERADAGTGAPMMAAGNDPDLSKAGHDRAEALAAALKDAKIVAIVTTEYKRTKQTAAPLAKAIGVEPIVVPARDTAAIRARIAEARGNVLVVGHSNTVPSVIKELGVAEPVEIADTEFDRLFVVVGGEKPTLVQLRYR